MSSNSYSDYSPEMGALSKSEKYNSGETSLQEKVLTIFQKQNADFNGKSLSTAGIQKLSGNIKTENYSYIGVTEKTINHVTSEGSLEPKPKESGVVSFEENSSFEKQRKKMELKS